MKKIFIILVIFSIIGCSPDEANNTQSLVVPSIIGKSFFAKTIIIEEEIDINNDGIFQKNITSEVPNFGTSLKFFENGKSNHPGWFEFDFFVETNNTGNLTQKFKTFFIDGILPFYRQENEKVYFYYDDQNVAIGTLSKDAKLLIIVFENFNNQIYDPSKGTILTKNGDIITYDGSITFEYELQ